MPLARIEVEQVENNRWVVSVEAGGMKDGPLFKRIELRATSFEEAAAAMTRAYYQQVPPPAPARMALEDEPVDTGLVVDPRDALREEAAALGIDVDNRWGEARLMAEIEKAKAAAVE